MPQPEKRAEIIAALEANPNAGAVAREVGGMSNVTVWRIAKQAGIELTAAAGRRRIPPEKRAAIIAALRANPHAKVAARQVGDVLLSTVQKISQTEGGRSAVRAARTEKRAAIIAALKANPNAGAVARQIGGISNVTVWEIAKQAGIELTAQRRRLPPEKRAAIIAALEANPNAGTRAVAREIGSVSEGTVRRIAKRAGPENLLTNFETTREHHGANTIDHWAEQTRKQFKTGGITINDKLEARIEAARVRALSLGAKPTRGGDTVRVQKNWLYQKS